MISKERQSGPVCVVGNSNSILRGGYIEIVRATYRSVLNLSLGSSSISLLGLRAEELVQQNSGIVILDLAVIDHVTNRNIPIDQEAHAVIFETFLATCAQNDIMPIILIMPSAWDHARDGISRRIFIEYGDKFGVPVFDGFRFIERLCTLRPEFTQEAHVESAHLPHQLARILGRSLIRSIERFKRLTQPSKCSTRFDVSFGRLSLASIVPDFQLRARTTALVSSNLAVLSEGQAISARVPSGSAIVGLAVNAVRCLTAILIETSAGRVVKDLRNPRSDPSSNPGNHLILVAWKLGSPLACPDGIVHVRCLDRAELAAESEIEPNDNGDCTDRTGSEVELDSLIYLQSGGPSERYCYTGVTDLVAAIGDDEILEDIASEPNSGIRIVGGDGNFVDVPKGYSYREDATGRITLVPPSWRQPLQVNVKPDFEEENGKMANIRSGTDGVRVTIPEGSTVREGKDGRLVAVPKGHSFRSGPDGRVVPFGPGESIRIGTDGRAVAIPEGASFREGTDGRVVAIGAGESFREGADGRMVAIPRGWTFRQGDDGRLVTLAPGQSFRQSKEGRVYPLTQAEVA